MKLVKFKNTGLRAIIGRSIFKNDDLLTEDRSLSLLPFISPESIYAEYRRRCLSIAGSVNKGINIMIA